jgi:hypothetical protein
MISARRSSSQGLARRRGRLRLRSRGALLATTLFNAAFGRALP